MDSEQHLASSLSASLSLQKVSFVPNSSPPPPQTIPIKYSPPSTPEGSNPVTIFGQTHQTVSCPVFGLFTSSSPEFGNRENLRLSTLPTRTQFKALPELWKPTTTEMNNNKAESIFHPLQGLHPFFIPAFKTPNPVDSQFCTSGVNRCSTSSPYNNNLKASLLRAEKKEKTPTNSSWSQKSQCECVQHQKTFLKTKEKDLIKISIETTRCNGCQSGSLSESSSETSCGSDNTENDYEDLSSDSNDPDSEKDIPVIKKHLTHNSSESKEKGPFPGDENACRESLCHNVPVTSSDQLQPHSHPVGLPTCTALVFHSAAEKSQQHTSVMHPSALTLDCNSLTQFHITTCPSLTNPVPNPILSKYKSSLTPSKHQLPSSASKPQSLLTSKHSSHYCKPLLPKSNTTRHVDRINERNKNCPHDSFLHLNNLKPKKAVPLMDSVKNNYSVQPTSQLCDTKQFMNPHLNRMISTANQDAPLALITKPRSQTDSLSSRPLLAAGIPPYLTPIKLSTGTKEGSDTSASPPKSSAPSGLVRGSFKGPSFLHGGWKPAKTSSCQKPVDLTRSIGFDFHSSKDLEDSSGDSGDEDEENSLDSDSSSSLSDSENNPESDGAEVQRKACLNPESHTDADRRAGLLNLQVTMPLGLPIANSLHYQGNLPPLTCATTAGMKKRVIDERVLQLPLKFGWQRETRIRTIVGRLQGEVAYFAPCGKKLRQYPDVVKYLVRHGRTEISRDNFSFSTKIKVGNFYEGREGPEGLQWFQVAEEDIAACIIAMDGQTKSKHQPAANAPGAKYHHHPVNDGEPPFQDVSEAKLKRKLEAQAQQAAQIKMRRKLEKQAMAQATKEAKKQQAIMAAEERRKKREEMKIHKQQEKIKHIQQIRMEKELRAQQVLEAKQKKKEAAANLKMLDAEKRKKEREIRKLQSVIQKHQERERRRQHMILMKAVEAQKKAESTELIAISTDFPTGALDPCSPSRKKERLKKERKEAKQLNKKKELELRRLKLTKAKELMKPKEDMCLGDHKPLPELSCIPGLILPGKTFSDCLMLLQFVRNFGAVLKLGLNSNQLTISNLQDGLLNIGNSIQKVQDLLVSLLSAAVVDPGIPAGQKCKTLLGDHLTNVEIHRDNVSEVLRIYIEAHSEQTEVAALAHSLQTKAFQAHSPSEKATMLAFLVNQLCCSKAVINKIDKNIDYMTNLRKDKWILEGKLRKLKNIYAKKKEKRNSNIGEENPTISSVIVQNNCKRKNEEEEDQERDGEDRGEDCDEEQEDLRGKKKKQTKMFGDNEAATHSGDINQLNLKIFKISKLQSEISQKLFEASHSLRSMMAGEDRYRRRYWLLPQCRGIFVEGVENEWEAKEKGKQRCSVSVKEEEQQGEISEQRREHSETKAECQQSNDDNDLQKSLSKLGKLHEAAKMEQYSNINAQRTHSTRVSITEPSHSHCTSQTDKTSLSSVLCAAQFNNNYITYSPQSTQPHQLPKVFTEKSSEWFSLLPRSPCDDFSVVSNTSCPAFFPSSQLIRTKPSSFRFPNTLRKDTKSGIDMLHSAVSQRVKSGIHQSSLTLCDMFSSATSSSLSFFATSITSQEAEGNRDEDLCLADCNSVDKSETTAAQSNKPACASFPALEEAETQDCICPQPVPEEMLRGWWRISDIENLHSLVKALHCRGIRERVLQKQIQKNMEHMTQIWANRTNESDTKDPETQKMSKEIFEGWCVEQRAVEVDSSLLLQVEALEKNVTSANLHIQGWMPGVPQFNREDLVNFEHKPSTSVFLENKKQTETHQGKLPGFLMRRSNNPLDIAVSRLAELERNIKKSNKVEVAAGMRQWHKALGQVRSSAQLSLCIQHLQKSIVWKRDVIKVYCQLCQKGDNEELLLLCECCDKSCHTYCHNPKISMMPTGSWFCSSCESGQIPPSGKQQSQTAGGKQKGAEAKQNGKPSVKGEPVSEGVASSNNMPKSGSKDLKRRKREDGSLAKFCTPLAHTKKAKTAKDGNSEMAVCWMLLAELEANRDAWPFLSPVKHKSVPGYRKVIKKPMDFSTIKEKLTNNLYFNLESFIIDVNLVFDNCQKFNEDDSEIGRAGHRMRRFFDKRWTELLH